MIREMLGLAEGILQDLHNDHGEVASLIEEIMDSEDPAERDRLFQEMKRKLLAHSQAEQEVLYSRLQASSNQDSRAFAQEGTSEHQTVEQQLRKMTSGADKTGDHWSAELKVLQDLVDHHVDEEEGTGFDCARDDFTKEELERMAQLFQRRKEELMMRAG